jgi:hypothetical protein
MRPECREPLWRQQAQNSAKVTQAMTQTPDYKDTVFLPQTEFPMRAGLPAREPEWLARWERLGRL